MKDFATKVNLTTTLTAAEFNNYIQELENFILQSGQTLDTPVDIVTQLGKAAAIYAAQSDFYADTGAADVYVVDPLGSFEAPIAYADSMRVRFVPDNANTGASTINVNAIGVKDIKKDNGATALAAGDLAAARSVQLEFVLSADAFTIVATENNALPPASSIGLQNSSFQASHFRASTTSGAAFATVELASGNDREFFDFDDTTEETIQIDFVLPKRWDAGTVTCKVLWAANSIVANDAVWGVQAFATTDGDALAGTYGAEVTVTDTNKTTAHDDNTSAETAAITITGAGKEREIHAKVARKAAAGGDTLVGDARFRGLEWIWTSDAVNDA